MQRPVIEGERKVVSPNPRQSHLPAQCGVRGGERPKLLSRGHTLSDNPLPSYWPFPFLRGLPRLSPDTYRRRTLAGSYDDSCSTRVDCKSGETEVRRKQCKKTVRTTRYLGSKSDISIA